MMARARVGEPKSTTRTTTFRWAEGKGPVYGELEATIIPESTATTASTPWPQTTPWLETTTTDA